MKKPNILLLFILISFASISSVIITPALPEISDLLQESKNATQFLMSVFLFGYVAGQLVYGPLGNRFGLKNTILVAALLALFSSIWTYVSVDMGSFANAVLSRFFLALFTSCGLKMTYAYLAHCYTKEETPKVTSLLMLSFSITPSLGIFLSGLITNSFGYKGALLFQTLYTLFCLSLFFLLPSEIIEKDESLTIRTVCHQFKVHFSNAMIIIPAILMGIPTAFIYCFATDAPFLSIDYLGSSPEVFGFFNLLPSLGLFIGSFLGIKVNAKFSSLSILKVALAIVSILSASYLFLLIYGNLSMWLIFIPVSILYIALALIQPNALSFALSAGHNKSYTSSAASFTNMFVAAFMVMLMSAFNPNITYLLGAFFCIFCFIAWVLIYIINQKINKSNVQ